MCPPALCFSGKALMLHLITFEARYKHIKFSHIGLFLIRCTTISTYPLRKCRGFMKVIAEYWKQLPNLNMVHVILGFPCGSDSKESVCDVGNLALILGLGRYPRGGHVYPLQYSCLENPHGQRSLAGCSPWGHKESDRTEWLKHRHITLELPWQLRQ